MKISWYSVSKHCDRTTPGGAASANACDPAGATQRSLPAHSSRVGTLQRGASGKVSAPASTMKRARRGVMADALVHEPDLIILDEPTIGLDPNQIRSVRQLIKSLAEKHTVLISTHILPEVEAVCDRVQIMHHGEVVFSNTIAGLRDFQQGRTVTVALHRPPGIDTLRSISGVTSVESAGDGRFRIQFAPDSDPSEALVSAAAYGFLSR